MRTPTEGLANPYGAICVSEKDGTLFEEQVVTTRLQENPRIHP